MIKMMRVDFKIQNLSLWRLQKHSGIKNKRTKVHSSHLENKKNGRRALHKHAPLTARKQRMVGFSSSTPSSPSCYYNGGLNNHTRCLRNRQHRQRRTRATSALRSSSSSSGSNASNSANNNDNNNNNNHANDSNGISPSSRTNSPSSSSFGGNGKVEGTNCASNVLFLQRLSTKVAALSASIAIVVASAPGAHFASFLNPWNSVSHSSSLVAYAEEQDTASSGKSDNGSTDTITVDNEKELSPDALVVDEVWQLVSDTFLPVRNDISVGFDREAWNALREEGVVKNPPKSRQEAYEYIRGMLSTLNDPFTRFVAPKDFQELLKYDISGVGLNVAEMPDNTSEVGVLGLVAESAGAKAGIKQGDVILSVDGVEVNGMSAFQVTSMIQGEGNTQVDLKIRRGEKGEEKSFALKRAAGPKNPVKSRLEGKSTGYIRLTEFNALAEKDVAEAIEELRDLGAKEFILDLRDNPGGLVQAGVEIAKLFLPQDATIAYTEGRVVAGGVKEDTDVNATENARLGLQNGGADAAPTKLKRIGDISLSSNDKNSNNFRNKQKVTEPLVVLVNSRSASASEILTGSLKDNCRATVVGSKTYGKGLIQSVYELNDGSGVVLTVGRYVTPKFVDIDRMGITPDFAMFPGFEVSKKSLDACELPKR